MYRIDNREDPALLLAPDPDPEPPRVEPTRWSSGRRVEVGLMLLGFAALGFCGLVSAEAGLYQAFQNNRLERLRQTEAGRAGKHRPAVAAGGLVGRIEIPSIGLSAMVREGSDTHTLLIAVGHVEGTAFPGEEGNVVVSGHRDSFFSDLGDIRKGDEVKIVTINGVYKYRVESTTVVGPGQTEVLDHTEAPTLTLITCYPFNFVGPSPQRFIVKARQVKESHDRKGGSHA